MKSIHIHFNVQLLYVKQESYNIFKWKIQYFNIVLYFTSYFMSVQVDLSGHKQFHCKQEDNKLKKKKKKLP